MAYSNDTTQIRSGMVNFVGALVNASKLPPRGARQDVAAILIEEALKLAREDDGSYDMYILKPLLRAVDSVSQNRINALNNKMSVLPKEIRVQAESTYNDYKLLQSTSNKILATVHDNAKH